MELLDGKTRKILICSGFFHPLFHHSLLLGCTSKDDKDEKD